LDGFVFDKITIVILHIKKEFQIQTRKDLALLDPKSGSAMRIRIRIQNGGMKNLQDFYLWRAVTLILNEGLSLNPEVFNTGVGFFNFASQYDF